VHKGFNVLDTVPHTLLALEFSSETKVHIVSRGDVPNPAWLRPGAVSKNQQAFGDSLLRVHPVVVVPSVVSTHSWNLLLDVATATDLFTVTSEPFALDTRLTAERQARGGIN